jgi:hypothetical protein
MRSGTPYTDKKLDDTEIKNNIRKYLNLDTNQFLSFIKTLLDPTQLEQYINITDAMQKDACEANKEKISFETLCTTELSNHKLQLTDFGLALEAQLSKVRVEILREDKRHLIESTRIPYTDFVAILGPLKKTNLRLFAPHQDSTREKLLTLAEELAQSNSEYTTLDKIKLCIEDKILIDIFNDTNKRVEEETVTISVVRELGEYFKSLQHREKLGIK